MDINTLRSLVTVLGLLCFLGICAWAYSRHSRQGFDEAEQLPFLDDDLSAVVRADDQRKDGHG